MTGPWSASTCARVPISWIWRPDRPPSGGRPSHPVRTARRFASYPFDVGVALPVHGSNDFPTGSLYELAYHAADRQRRARRASYCATRPGRTSAVRRRLRHSHRWTAVRPSPDVDELAGPPSDRCEHRDDPVRGEAPRCAIGHQGGGRGGRQRSAPGCCGQSPPTAAHSGRNMCVSATFLFADEPARAQPGFTVMPGLVNPGHRPRPFDVTRRLRDSHPTRG